MISVPIAAMDVSSTTSLTYFDTIRDNFVREMELKRSIASKNSRVPESVSKLSLFAHVRDTRERNEGKKIFLEWLKSAEARHASTFTFDSRFNTKRCFHFNRLLAWNIIPICTVWTESWRDHFENRDDILIIKKKSHIHGFRSAPF